MWLKYAVKHSSFCLKQPKQILFSATEFWPLKMSYPLWILSNFLFSHRTSCILTVFFFKCIFTSPNSDILLPCRTASSFFCALQKAHVPRVLSFLWEACHFFSFSWVTWQLGSMMGFIRFFFFFSDHTSWLMWSYFPNERSSSASLVKASNSNPWTTR